MAEELPPFEIMATRFEIVNDQVIPSTIAVSAEPESGIRSAARAGRRCLVFIGLFLESSIKGLIREVDTKCIPE